MTLLYTHDLFLRHETGRHPECPERLRAISRRLHETDLPERCIQPVWSPVSDTSLAAVHSLEYAADVARACENGGGRIEADTVVSTESYAAARLAAGALSDAVRRVVAGEDRSALCLVRPPGHHALRDASMGFCLFNNVAVAARVATRELELERVLIVDWDVHHGNGTQAAFWEDPQVGFYSIHRWPFYPGTGASNETGGGAGLGTTYNVPVEYGTSRREYLATFTRTVEEFAERVQPQLVLLSAGFDAHRDDPVGSLGLENEDFEPLTRVVQDIAATYAQGRLVSTLEGGYHTERLAECVELHLRLLLG
ncbi:MAG: histone deacetylase [Planctomycetales bacterium]|nr:histone deacetylase [Planctomycetales bacterium]